MHQWLSQLPIRRIIYLTLCLSLLQSLLLGLTACSSSIWDRSPPALPVHAGVKAGAASGAVIGGIASGGVGVGIGTVVGTILGASFGDILQSHYSQVDKLQYLGVQVILVGDEVRLILPSSRFFRQGSAQLNTQYYPVLNLVGDLIRDFPKVSVKVSGYTDDLGSWRRNLALSRAQAQHIMIYLTDYGIDSRLISAQGYGNKYPIANNNRKGGPRLNNRVEITLRKIREPKL